MTTEQFWSKVDKSFPAPTYCSTYGPCWLWVGYIDKDGYGYGNFEGKAMRAHRYSWLLRHGTYASAHILHRCDNPPCVNPDHLFEGTQKDNIHDCIAKGRFTTRKEIASGSNFGFTVVLGVTRSPHRGRSLHYDCRCMLCNSTRIVSGTQLRYGASLACMACEKAFRHTRLPYPPTNMRLL